MKGMKSIIKYIAMIFSFASVLLCLSACKSDKSENEESISEPITIHVVAFGTASDDASERVSAALSEITMEKIGCNVEVELFSLTNFQSELNKMMLAGNGPDVFSIFEQRMLSSLVENNKLLILDDYKKEYNVIFSAYHNEDDWNCLSINNHIYAVPTTAGGEYSLGLCMRSDICEMLGIDAESINTLDEAKEVLEMVRDETDLAPLVSHFGKINAPLGEDKLGDGLGVLLDLSSGDTTVENFYESDKYYNYCKTMYEWYQEGLILENAISSREANSDLIASDIGFAYLARYYSSSLKSSQQRAKYDLSVAQLSDLYIDTNTHNLGWGISSDSEYPDYAMAFISLLYTETDAANLCVYGMEGYEYEVVSDNVVTEAVNETEDKWISVGWSWPNLRISAAYQTLSGTLYDFRKLQGNLYVSPAYGFVFDSSSVRSEVDNCKAIVDKYNAALSCGMLNPDIAIPEFNAGLKQAGIDKIIFEKQRQLNDFLLKNGD